MGKINYLKKLFPEPVQAQIVGDRCQGTTTGEALRLIGTCILDPGQWYEVKDHRQNVMNPTMSRMQLQIIMQMCQKLGLQFFQGMEGKGENKGKIYVRSAHITDAEDPLVKEKSKLIVPIGYRH